MFHILNRRDQRKGAIAKVEFDGEPYGAGVSFVEGNLQLGKGPGLHKHPYPETCIVLSGQALMVVDGEEVVAGPGSSPPPQSSASLSTPSSIANGSSAASAPSRPNSGKTPPAYSKSTTARPTAGTPTSSPASSAASIPTQRHYHKALRELQSLQSAATAQPDAGPDPATPRIQTPNPENGFVRQTLPEPAQQPPSSQANART